MDDWMMGIGPFGLRRLAWAWPGLREVKNAKKEFFRRDLPLVTATYRNVRLGPKK